MRVPRGYKSNVLLQIKMSADQEAKQNGNGTAPSGVSMESVHRIAQLPVVESTIQTATNIYGKVKVISV